MRIRWNFSGCADADKRQIHLAWLDVQPALEARLEEIDVNVIDLVFSVSRFAKHSLPWRVHASLQLSSNRYVADVQMSTCELAVDECVARIAEQLAEDPQLECSWNDSRDGLAVAID
jgi:hypothetical protein